MATNLTASIQDRLKNQSRKDKVNFATLLEQFALSRFFARLSESEYSKNFILKGAQLFRLWSNQVHRPTRDADFLSFGTINPEELETIFKEICNQSPSEPDAIEWFNIVASPIREENAYGGVRVKITAILGNMKIPLQIDVGYGDIITPTVKQEEWQSILGFKNIPLKTYPVETVIAEKLEAMISLGMANSRMKDFYDLHWIFNNVELDSKKVKEAIHNTFERRKTPMPVDTPIALTSEFHDDKSKNTQWNAFIKKNKLSQQKLIDVIHNLKSHLTSQFLK